MLFWCFFPILGDFSDYQLRCTLHQLDSFQLIPEESENYLKFINSVTKGMREGKFRMATVTVEYAGSIVSLQEKRNICSSLSSSPLLFDLQWHSWRHILESRAFLTRRLYFQRPRVAKMFNRKWQILFNEDKCGFFLHNVRGKNLWRRSFLQSCPDLQGNMYWNSIVWADFWSNSHLNLICWAY